MKGFSSSPTRIHAAAGCLFLLGSLATIGCASNEGLDPAPSAGASRGPDDDFGRSLHEGYFTGSDGHPVRYKVYKSGASAKALVLFLHGYGEFIEKYNVLFSAHHEFPAGVAPANQTLADLPITFIALEIPGQGKSVTGRVPGHFVTFDEPVGDAETLLEIAKGIAPDGIPTFVMGHSTGGLIATRLAEAHPDLVNGLILSSPLWGFNTPADFATAVAELASDFATPPPEGLGLGDRCTRTAATPLATLFALAKCHHDAACVACLADSSSPTCASLTGFDMPGLRAAFAFLSSPDAIGCPRDEVGPAHVCTPGDPLFNGTTTDFGYCAYAANHPLTIGASTIGWLHESLKAIDAADRELSALTMPVLVLSARADPIVSPAEHGRICGLIPRCTLEQYPRSGDDVFLHELLAEKQRELPIGDVRDFLLARLAP